MNKNNFALVYFVSKSFFLGIIFSNVFKLTGNDSIIASLIGTIIGSIIIFLIHKLKLNEKNKIILMLLYTFIILYSIIIIETFVSSFFLVSTPKIFIILPTILVCLYAVYKGYDNLVRCSKIFIIFSFSLLFLITISLIGYCSVKNITPLFIHPIKKILNASVIFGSLSAIPNILIDTNNISLKSHLKYYIITSIINMMIGYIIIATLTPNVAQIYSFPEYMVLKRIKIFEFIENVENILTSIWFFDFFFMLSLTMIRIKNILKNNKVFITYISILTILTTIFELSNYYKVLYLYHYGYLITLGLFLLLIIIPKKRVIISNEKYK